MKKYKKTLFVGSSALLIVLILFFGNNIFFIKKGQDYEVNISNASSQSIQLTDGSQWNVGNMINTISNENTVNIESLDGLEIDLVQYASENPFSVTASSDAEDVLKPVDGEVDPLVSYPASCWEVHLSVGPEQHEWWQVDLGEQYEFSSIRIFADGLSSDFKIQSSSNGVDFNDESGYDFSSAGYLAPDWYEFSFSSSARYLRIETKLVEGMDPDPFFRLSEFEIFSSTEGYHTSAATQINGGDNFIAWETFTPSQSVPENTTLTYRFRSSTDATTWDSWSEYQTYSGSPIDISELVTSVSGEDKYKYLQVESKFTSSDGVSTPTLFDYTVNYHTNVAPSTPTAMTAVVGQ